MKIIIFFASIIFSTHVAIAAPSSSGSNSGSDKGAQLRLFYGKSSIDPINVNQAINSEGLDKVTTLKTWGVEAMGHTASRFDFGVRYTTRTFIALADSSHSSKDYSLNGDVATLHFMGRFYLYKSDLIRFDIGAGIGGVAGKDMHVSLKSSKYNGSYKVIESKDWGSSPSLILSSSMAFGFRYFYIYSEVGMEKFTVRNLSRTGTTNPGIEKFNLGGGYVYFGLIIEGAVASSAFDWFGKLK